MTKEEQNALRCTVYAEAMRYMSNAEETLAKARKDGRYYVDKKYVSTACGTAYLGVLIALDAWLRLKDVPLPKRNRQKSIEFYMSSLAQLDRKMVDCMDGVYDVLHKKGYYHGNNIIKIIESGFEGAYEIIEKIKPQSK